MLKYLPFKLVVPVSDIDSKDLLNDALDTDWHDLDKSVYALFKTFAGFPDLFETNMFGNTWVFAYFNKNPKLYLLNILLLCSSVISWDKGQ